MIKSTVTSFHELVRNIFGDILKMQFREEIYITVQTPWGPLGTQVQSVTADLF